ncbi:hypothetical protein RINTHM_17020 [Richelia intracellularis HM01]|nr:hypothetical protein RINTHM_17020 [Richelia intracellularis HM01]
MAILLIPQGTFKLNSKFRIDWILDDMLSLLEIGVSDRKSKLYTR